MKAGAQLRMGQQAFPASALVTPDMAGKHVTLSLRFKDGRARELSGLLASVGSGGGVVMESWPTSFKHEEVTAVQMLKP